MASPYLEQAMIMEWDAECVDDYGGIPKPGDFIVDDLHGKLIVTRTMICNRKKVELKVEPASEDILSYEAPDDTSTANWDEIDDKYLPSEETNFLDEGLSP